MNQLLSIVDDKIVIDKLRVKFTEGALTHAGSLEVVGTTKFNDDVTIAKNAVISGTITADTINVKHIICDEAGGVNDPFAFTANTEKELDGRGFQFTDGNATRQFVFKEGNKMWSTMNLDLARDKHFSIDNVPVINSTSLGDGIVNSGLQTVGELKSLKVSGAVSFAEFAFFNHNHNRLGINTDNPNGAIGIQENNVDIVLGSYRNDYAYIGTYNNSSLELGTDNTARITLKNTGEIDIGHGKYKNAVVRIHGKLEVDELVTANESSSPLSFVAKNGNTIYGTGIVWYHERETKQFTYASSPDRIWSTEIIDLSNEKYYAIDSAMVLSKNRLGDSVTESNLTRLGKLNSLEVGNDSNFYGIVNIGLDNDITLSNQGIKFAGNNNFTITTAGVIVDNGFSVTCDNEQEFKIDRAGSIELGNKQNSNRKIALFGQVSVGANTPEDNMALTVNGPVSLNNKRFVKGESIPTTGRFSLGDICWNTQPKATDYVGWICIREGTPGEWLPFGQIQSK